MAQTLSEKFLMRVRRAPSGCWEWVGVRDRKGYGSFTVPTPTRHTTRMAHRVAYELFTGPIPPEYDVDHLCRNRGCVRPLHLQAVPRLENLRRARGKYARSLTLTKCPQGHPYSGDNLIIRSNGGRRCRACHNQGERERRKRRKAHGPGDDGTGVRPVGGGDLVTAGNA